MPCYHPRQVLWRDGGVVWSTPSFRSLDVDSIEKLVNIPCGQCLGCKGQVQRDWALRSYHEATLHESDWMDSKTRVVTKLPNSCVLTLTYDQDHLPIGGALCHDDFQRFMKRLREFRTRVLGLDSPLRYFMCGEYGKKGRPHFHCVLYGHTFHDTYECRLADGKIVRMSYSLDRLWSQPSIPGEPATKIGNAVVDEFSFAGAAYVAGYVAKKRDDFHRGPWAEIAPGTITPVNPEYRKMSTRLPARFEGDKPPGGLGGLWIEKNWKRVYDRDYCEIGEWRFRTPRYYDKVVSRIAFDAVHRTKAQRVDLAHEQVNEWTPARAAAAELIELSKFSSRPESLA